MNKPLIGTMKLDSNKEMLCYLVSCLTKVESKAKATLIFSFMGLADHNFWQIKRIIILISHINIFYYFLLK